MTIKTKPPSKEYDAGWEAIFKKETDGPEYHEGKKEREIERLRAAAPHMHTADCYLRSECLPATEQPTAADLCVQALRQIADSNSDLTAEERKWCRDAAARIKELEDTKHYLNECEGKYAELQEKYDALLDWKECN